MAAIPVFVMPSMFVAIQLVAAIMILDSKGFAAQTQGDMALDFLRYIRSLELEWPLATVAAVHVFAAVRDAVRGKQRGGESFPRIFVMIGLFIFALGPTSVMMGQQGWALMGMTVIKSAFEIWFDGAQREVDEVGAKFEKERAEYLASLDPRGTGTWPTPPPPKA